MRIQKVLRRNSLIVGCNPSSKDELLHIIADKAAGSTALKHCGADKIYEGLTQRENLGSTGFGGGIAIPHCRLPEVKEFVVGLVSCPNGITFDALDNEPVKLAVFIVAPDTKSEEHIHLLSAISQILAIPGAVDELIAARTEENLYECFLRHSVDGVEQDDEEQNFRLFQIMVRDDSIFLDILEVMDSLSTGSTITLEAEPASKYLCKAPLFASFWTDAPESFCQLIVARVCAKMTNETIRRLERVCGPLKENKQIQVLVQDLFFCSGQAAV